MSNTTKLMHKFFNLTWDIMHACTCQLYIQLNYADCTGFPCDDGGCTTLSIARCDGTDNCADGSDEANCGKFLI